jgi:hypothetical protein
MVDEQACDVLYDTLSLPSHILLSRGSSWQDGLKDNGLSWLLSQQGSAQHQPIP